MAWEGGVRGEVSPDECPVKLGRFRTPHLSRGHCAPRQADPDPPPPSGTSGTTLMGTQEAVSR